METSERRILIWWADFGRRLSLNREVRTHARERARERRRYINAATPPGCVRTRTFAVAMLTGFVAFLLLAGGFALLYYRTSQVCGPLRFGEEAGGRQAQTAAGKDYARTFGDAADHLGCGKG